MSTALLSLLLDGLVLLLLGATISVCLKLNKRIRILQDSKSELAELIRQFDESTQQATLSIGEIHKVSRKLNENMQGRLDKANYLADDLAFMIEKAGKMADRMEGNLNGNRNAGERAAALQPSRARLPEAAPPEPRESRESLPEPVRQRPPADAPRNSATKSLDTLMERFGGSRKALSDNGAENAAEAAPAARPARPRSRSEQELADALKRK